MRKSLAKAMCDRKMIKSFSEARRLVYSGVVEVNGVLVKTFDKEVEEKEEIKIVKRKK